MQIRSEYEQNKKIFQPLIWIAGSVLLIRLESENLSILFVIHGYIVC